MRVFFKNCTAEQIFRNVWWRVNGWQKAVLSPRGLRWGDEQKQLQMLVPIRNEANVWGTKGRKTQTLCCVPRPATRPILVVFRTPAAKCKRGSAELFYLGQLIYTVCIQAFNQRENTWSLLACFEGCGTRHKSCSFHCRRINSGSRSPAFFPPQLARAYSQNHHPCLALSELDCSHQRGFFRTSRPITALLPAWKAGGLQWVTLSEGPSVSRLIHLTDWLKNLVVDAGFCS